MLKVLLFLNDLLCHPVDEFYLHRTVQITLKYLLKSYIFHVSCREKLEDELEKEARYRQLMAHSSHDSAIDTDSMEWETEVVEFEKHRVRIIWSFLFVF